MVHASSSFLPNIIKICLRISKLWSAQDFGFRGGKLHNKESESCLSSMWHAYWSSSSFLQNIIKICLRISKLWSAQDFGFWGDNYITKKKVRVVSLACDRPTGLPLNLFQILSYCLKQYGIYGLYKISASGETTT